MKERELKPNRAMRCAIYTRVSTDQGLEQDFNSLDAQRESSEAYIRSQAHEGWRLVKERYDDGGFSGGSLDRPALQKLLAAVREKRVDVVVVYKVDRLTRSLADFAKLVELFDANGVSFVSVTQSFNTTTSMGRLTLNILLSFAQFEREVTGERIRDKIAASKRKGMWMGGVVPLGYRVEDRAIHIVEEHAEIVRMLFRRYLSHGSVVNLKQALEAEDVRIPTRIDGAGKPTGGGRFGRGHLYKILSNPIYIGEIVHKSRVYPGLHAPIVDRDLWDEVQRRLNQGRAGVREKRANQSSEALLVGKLFDDRGNRMSPTWARKGSKRWAYYVSQAALQGDKSKAGSIVRVSAADIEGRVVAAVVEALEADAGGEAVGSVGRSAARGAPTAHLDAERRAEIRSRIDRVTISRTTIEITLFGDENDDGQPRILAVPWTLPSPYRRRQIIQVSDGDASGVRPMRVSTRRVLIASIRQAHLWFDELIADPRLNVAALASRESKSERSIAKTLSLACLAPALVKAAVEGRLPRGVGLTRLMDLPAAWSEQWRALGLQQPATG